MKTDIYSEFNKLDLNIIKHLRQDGRIPNSRLADMVGLSATACAARVKHLEKKGIIKGYTAIIDDHLLLGENMAFVQVTMNSTSAPALEAFNREVAKISEIEQCHMIAANFDYLLKVRSVNMTDYRRIFADKISTLPHVKQTSTFIVMESVKD
ncbi:ArsR family transcriptional regulator [Formosimonas limnophila]|uniref:ArsR family transcriptional regulator n=1 Tax=Formosimonas limnophila TaxID=1384487 RepID=A0A8J3G0G4_9BURK|nr:Lrp/AsnC ligand binding domain-containing protein [Formosimonas limnophila]GHA69887.1 ArsR family transcriptional regulator [Formosimonas limnophila]